MECKHYDAAEQSDWSIGLCRCTKQMHQTADTDCLLHISCANFKHLLMVHKHSRKNSKRGIINTLLMLEQSSGRLAQKASDHVPGTSMVSSQAKTNCRDCMQVGPSFFDAPGAAVAEMPGRNPADYHDVDVTIVFCSGCNIKVRQLSHSCSQTNRQLGSSREHHLDSMVASVCSSQAGILLSPAC